MSEPITGSVFRDAVISAANNITNHRKAVDELNVFPVPDGDTGTNMSMTINNAARQLALITEDKTLEFISKETSSALLRGARGNSGVILSLLFRGISKGFKGLESAGGVQLAAALKSGVDSAYRAVMKPTEGTVLTVSRMAAEKAVAVAGENNDPVFVLEKAVEAAKASLAETPEMLPVLKKAGVVDAGGQGFVYVLEGMLSVIRDRKIIEAGEENAKPTEAAVAASADFEEEINFTYCTEFIVKRDRSINRDPIKLRAFLETIGDCVVVVDDPEIIKVHVHSDNPGKAIQEGLKFGQLTNIKIDNMREQNEKILNEKKTTTSEGEDLIPVAPEKPYGFVAVAAGKGLVELFEQLGADRVVEGGQTMNPSTDDILRAIEATPAETVFVLPNNKNIVMAAEQAAPLATRKVCVLTTLSVPMGISAMLAFDEDADTEQNLIDMGKAAERTSSGQITFAARDSNFDGHEIKKGEILALKNGKVSFIEQDMIKAVGRLAKLLAGRNVSSMTLICGKDVDQETVRLAAQAVEAKAGNADVSVIDGGQPVYYFIISAEEDE